MELFWEFYQQGRIAQVQSAAQRGESKAADAVDMAQHFQDRLDKLVLVNMAMWSLLKEHSDLNEEDLLKRIEEIDLSDGKLDGKVRITAIVCPNCGRKMSNKHRRCLYCEHEPKEKGAFDTLTG